MATCPDCGASSRVDPTAFDVTETLVASPIGEWSLAGVQLKTPATVQQRLTCRRCGWFVTGRVDSEGSNFIADPPATKEA